MMGFCCWAVGADSSAEDAQFLIQATFGPTRAGLAELQEAGSYEAWMEQQFAVPQSSHRAFYRQRANGRVADSRVASHRSPCVAGSLWHEFAFMRADVGKRVQVMDSAVYIDGKLRTQLDPLYVGNKLSEPDNCTDQRNEYMLKQDSRTCSTAAWKWEDACAQSSEYENDPDYGKICQRTCYHYGRGYAGDDCSSGWASVEFDGFLCKTVEEVGGWVALGTDADCDEWIAQQNPAIWFQEWEANHPSVEDEAVRELRPGYLMLTTPVNCRRYIIDEHLAVGDRLFAWDPRLALRQNDLDAPAVCTDRGLCPVVERSFLNEGSCRINYAHNWHFLSCGSPGEVANNPALGHHVGFYVGDDNDDQLDTLLDFRFGVKFHANTESRGAVWMSVVLNAEDQLRQRVAWALSQIWVVGPDKGRSSECLVNYYDIFVQNAFTNYRDIMREVTFSPMMGDYLSFANSKSFDKSGGKYPDENYAREIMQLFTIGLWQLNPNGTKKTDQNGDPIHTYTNEDIMSFARVFTGLRKQLYRANVEVPDKNNQIDPMVMEPSWHDIYPKEDLHGGYLGDGYPLCADMRADLFLSEGSKYEFLGSRYVGGDGADVMEVDADSELYAALWPWQPTVVLNHTLACHADQCKTSNLKIVKVGGGFYRYLPPACVSLYFFNGRIAAKAKEAHFHQEGQQICANPDAPLAGTACCRGCTNKPLRWMVYDGFSCENPHSNMFTNHCRNANLYRNNLVCQLACWENGVGYDGDNCSAGEWAEARSCGYLRERVRFATASATCESMGMSVCKYITRETSCGYDEESESYLWRPEACSLQIEVRSDGTVSSQQDDEAMMNRVAVHWEDGSFPAQSGDGVCPGDCEASASGCLCPVGVEQRVVFGEIPSAEELRQSLKIGAFKPGADHTCLEPCNTDVLAFVKGDSIADTETIFKHGSAYFRNMESVVSIGSYSFRNAPTLLQQESFDGKHRFTVEQHAAIAEVESLLDHLFYHPNTATFVAHRLILRLVTSNPSPAYVAAVAEAFRTGLHEGVECSGEYGDMKATVAAILLHDEARGRSPDVGAGKLREPLVKVVHFLRSMEYRPYNDHPVQFANLLERIGQWPYESPEVFNFYHADFEPAGFEPGLVAPEFQIFTTPLAVDWLNGVSSLIETDLNSVWLTGSVKSGFGSRAFCEPVGLAKNANYWCSQGNITWQPEDPSQFLSEVSLLLTGGRFSDNAAVQQTTQNSEDPLRAALQTVVASAEFPTLGECGATDQKLEPTPAPPAKEPDSYKAVVMVHLNGGADTFSMVVPRCSDLYDQYKQVRDDVALQTSKLPEISASTQACGTFGVHHKLPFVRSLYTQGQLAFVSNIGSLVEPTTGAQWRSGGARTCSGMFSHSDQRHGAQTLKCQVAGASPKGFGGRLADALTSASFTTNSFSMSGVSTWSQGASTSPNFVSKSGPVRLQRGEQLDDVIGNVTGIRYSGMYADYYSTHLAEAVKSSYELSDYMDAADLQTEYADETNLAKQLKQVATLIAAREARKAERDIFYVVLGGFDSHNDNHETIDEKFVEVDNALDGFVAELRGQGIFDSVVLVTSSEFGRTLTTNGQGTDHGWAGNHLVLGGSVNGGNIFNKFPTDLLEGNSQDAGRGRLIPEYPWESMMSPIAQWMGANPDTTIFPNLANFGPSHIINMTNLFT